MYKIRYVLKNVFTGAKHLKFYHISQVELGGLSGLFDFENYEIVSRDRFTGLKDKNGKEIYEGDILRCNSWIGHNQRKLHNNFVDFYAGATHCGFRVGNNKFRKRLTWNLIYNTESVVIGNIHQNPELLKGDKNG